jgi:hypothetical protein
MALADPGRQDLNVALDYWVEWLAVALLGVAIFLYFEGDTLASRTPGGGFLAPSVIVGIFYWGLSWLLGGLGVLLFAVRPLARVNWPALPVVLVLVGAPLWIGRYAGCQVIYGNTLGKVVDFGACTGDFAWAGLDIALFSVVLAIRQWQLRRRFAL